METIQNILSNYSDSEKTAYLSILTALATSDREATNEELEHIRELSAQAGLSDEQESKIIEAGKDASGDDLKNSLDVLKESDLRYGLITDLITIAKADEHYTSDEQKNIERVSRYLNINNDQFSVLDEFVDKASEEDLTPSEYKSPNFLQSTGMQDKFSNAGFNMQSIGKSLFGFLGPMLLGTLASKTLGRRNNTSGANQGSGLGGMLGSMLSGNNNQTGLGGGLGSLLSGLSQSKNSGSMGSLLGRLLK